MSRRHLSTDILEKIKHLYVNEGWGVESIAKHLGISQTAVYYHLTKMGLIRQGRRRVQIPQITLEKFEKLLKAGWPPKTASRKCNIPWHIGLRVACELGYPPFTKSEGMKRFRRIAAGFPADRGLSILSKEELFEAMIIRADQVFLTDFIGYNYVEKRALCQTIFNALPSKLQERLLAYVIALMSKGKATYSEVAETIQGQGLLQDIKMKSTADLVRLWQEEKVHPLGRYFRKAKTNQKTLFIKGDLEYLIGRFLGDASIPYETTRRKNLTLYSKDYDSICYASQLLKKANIQNEPRYSKKKGYYILPCHNYLLYWLLRRLKDSAEFAQKFGDYLCLDPNMAWRFIQGMADSEGCCSIETNQFGDPILRIIITNKKRHILELCKRCLEENGIITHMKDDAVYTSSKPHVIACAKKQIFLLNRRKNKLEKLIKLVYNERL